MSSIDLGELIDQQLALIGAEFVGPNIVLERICDAFELGSFPNAKGAVGTIQLHKAKAKLARLAISLFDSVMDQIRDRCKNAAESGRTVGADLFGHPIKPSKHQCFLSQASLPWSL